jgi:poly-beta-1,6-N-acetyl-D-glucosamine synthase
MKISVIIPTYNEIGVLEKCIESLGFQTEDNFEIIVVNDGSTDKTNEILRNLQLTIPGFKFYEQEHKGAGEARNFGAKHANGDILVFVDADMTFDSDFIKKLTLPITRGGSKGTFSKEEYVNNWDNVWARCWNINEDLEPRRRHGQNHPDKQPVFRAILKKEFESVGGFDKGGYDDDWSLARKLGYEAICAPNAVFYHKNPATLSEVFNHSKWVGKRRYKLGIVGIFIALIRSSIPTSLLVGMAKAIYKHNLYFFVFKIVYDFGIFIGILDLLLTGKTSK